MYDALLALQYISVIGLFIECWIIFKSWKDRLRAYLFFGCFATLLNNLGYVLELRAKTLEAYVTALKFSYSGRIWITLALFLFSFELCRIKVPQLIIRILIVIHAVIYSLVLTFEHHELYYSEISLDFGGDFPVFYHVNGPVHGLFTLLQVVYIILGVSALIISYIKETKKNVKIRLMLVILALSVEVFFFVLQLMSPVRIYDITMLGFMLGTVIMFISIFRFNLLGTRDIARDFMVDRLSEGVIAVDNEGDVQYYNEPASLLYPALKTEPLKVVEEVRGAILHGDTVEIDGRIYTPEENDLLYKGESFGRLYVLIDATEHFKRLKKEKKILRKELLTDPLTGFYNRKGMEYYSEKLYNDVLKDKKALFICVADMNGLKYINDNFGHENGDRALRELASVIRDSLKKGDIAFRSGGDEFLIMGGRSYLSGAEKEFTERIEELLKEKNETAGLPYKVDMSYGPVVKELTGKTDELDELIKLSDGLMYEMKKSRDAHRR
ncbi:MAG: diguanylate cyclase [Lachnospiraceae bacterium]|nr:diguanylate cyclase [Lachnospiraceae bacterium]